MSQESAPPESMSAGLSINAGWGLPLQVFYCAHCHSAHLAPTDVTLTTCPACLQDGLSAQPERLRREPPELVVPFAVSEESTAGFLTEWSRGIRFRPDDLAPELLLRRIRRYYLPLWLVDGDVEATWQAEMGYDYQAASFREQYVGGQWVSQEVTETRVRWESRVGRLKRHYDNVAVPAMEDHDRWMLRLEGYDYRARKEYSARAMAGSVVRIPDHAPDAAWPDAEGAFDRAAALECQAASEAHHIRNWSMRAGYSNLNWTQMLAPAFVTYYREGEKVYPIWINGQSGHVSGTKRMSQRKASVTSLIIGAVAILLFFVGALIALVGAVLVAPLAIGAVLIGVSLLLGLIAPIPAMWVWFRNRSVDGQ